jgi:hypothetical protein
MNYSQFLIVLKHWSEINGHSFTFRKKSLYNCFWNSKYKYVEFIPLYSASNGKDFGSKPYYEWRFNGEPINPKLVFNPVEVLKTIRRETLSDIMQ